jgi:hypothetical protein
MTSSFQEMRPSFQRMTSSFQRMTYSFREKLTDKKRRLILSFSALGDVEHIRRLSPNPPFGGWGGYNFFLLIFKQ